MCVLNLIGPSFCHHDISTVCVLVTSTRLHAQKHLWHDRGESSPATAQEDAQQHTARTLKTLQNRSRDSRTEGVLTREAKTGTKKQQHAGEHPARDPPGTAHHCVRAKHNPRRAAARRVRVQPPMPQPTPHRHQLRRLQTRQEECCDKRLT